MPHKYASVEGVATFVHHAGPTTLPEVVPDLSRGEVVLCLHASGGNGAVFADLLQALAADHSPLAIDFPGHGRSGVLAAQMCTCESTTIISLPPGFQFIFTMFKR